MARFRLDHQVIAYAAALAACTPYKVSEGNVSDYWLGASSFDANPDEYHGQVYVGAGVGTGNSTVVCWSTLAERGRCLGLDGKAEAWSAPEHVHKLLWSSMGPVWIATDGTLDYDLQCPTQEHIDVNCDPDGIAGLDRLVAESTPVDVVASTRQVCVLNMGGTVDCHAGFTPDLPFEVAALRAQNWLWVCALGADGERACWNQGGLVDLSAWPERVNDVSVGRRPCVLDDSGALRCARWESPTYVVPDDPFVPRVTLAEDVTELVSYSHSHVPVFRRTDGRVYHVSRRDRCEIPGDDPGVPQQDCVIEPLPEGPYVKQHPPCLLTEGGRLTCDWDMEALYGG